MTAKSLALLLAATLSTVASAQTWSRSYEAGLTAARAGKWAEARTAFQQAAADRPEDRSAATVLPGPATERRVWRNGAPYSPNFLAAYALYRQALLAGDPMESANLMKGAAGEFEMLISKDQASAEAFFFLDVIYTKLGDTTKRQAAADRFAKLGRKPDFKVDTESVAPEEIAAIGARSGGTTIVAPTSGGTNNAPIVRPEDLRNGNPVAPNGTVLPVATKFALVVGQSQSRLSGGLVPYAASDAKRVRDALVSFAGYPADNVIMLQDASASEMKAAAATLSTRVGKDSTVLIYYAGAGVNLGGKDYLAGADTESASDTASMVAKTDLFAPFVQKGSRIFAFFEANRPIDANGFFFGREVVTVGSVAQIQSTIPGATITPTYQDNQPIGLFTSAFVSSLSDLRSNKIPVFEFTWTLSRAMRGGETGSFGGGGRQICTLPQLSNIAADARF